MINQCCADKLAALFPQTFGKPTVHVEPATTTGASAAPLRIGAVLSGGQAAGGHNVIAGLYDAIKRVNPEGVLYGFLDGPRGLFTGTYITIDDALMNEYRNMGGFDIIGSGRDKIETAEQFAGSRAVAETLGLHGVIVIGGDDSNTNAAVLAEYFAANGSSTKVIGCPKTIDGDLKIPGQVDISFGYVFPLPPAFLSSFITAPHLAGSTRHARCTRSSSATCAWTRYPAGNTGISSV
jgi:pyrophosphate--fructose-6-phosphate 1-phosphotransferase